jgi:ribosomal protein L40E
MRVQPAMHDPERGRMSKKGKTKATCLGCGGRMKAKDVACRKCGWSTPAGEACKAMIASGVHFIGKSMRPQCPRCRATSRPSAKHCKGCGSPLLMAVKSAGEMERDRYLALARQEADPGRREVFWRLANPDVSNAGRAS